MSTTYTKQVSRWAPLTSSIFSEIYLQYMESIIIYDILKHNNITGYFCYVDILIVYNKTTTDIMEVFNSFNKLLPTMKFTIEKEMDNMINFLDITIMTECDGLTFDIYRKPTTTDCSIPYDSCHLTEHKLAAVRYLTNRMNTYWLNSANREKERNTIKHILQNSKYETSIMNIPPKTPGNKSPVGSKWAKFTYIGKETKYITKLFKNSSFNISYTTRNTIRKLLSQKPHPNRNKFEGSGIYQLALS